MKRNNAKNITASNTASIKKNYTFFKPFPIPWV